MNDFIWEKDLYDRYMKACHAMQTGVLFMMGHTVSHHPKHLRVGINSALVEHSALALLLIEKGIISHKEYQVALVEGMEQEKKRYEDKANQLLGVKNTSFG